jgi:hypothetical protein
LVSPSPRSALSSSVVASRSPWIGAAVVVASSDGSIACMITVF